MGFKTIKMEWDLCRSPPWIPFYPYTMFQNPMSKSSCQKSRKTILTQKVHVTQSYHIVHCNLHLHKPICADFQAYVNTFSHTNWCLFVFFIFFCWGSSADSQKFHILLILTGENASKWLECAYLGFKMCQIQWHRFWVCTISSSWKITISGKNIKYCWLWLGKMHQNGLSGAYLGFKVCWIQWHCFESLQ